MISHCAVDAARDNRKEIYIHFCVFCLIFVQSLVPFVFGAIAFDVVYNIDLDKSALGRATKYLLTHCRLLIFTVGMYFASINQSLTGLWKPFAYLPQGLGATIVRAFGISICLIYVARNEKMKRIFSFRPLVCLGKISPYIYAFHWPLILSIGCGLYLYLFNKLDRNYCVILVSTVVLVSTLVLSQLYIWLLQKIQKLWVLVSK